MNAPRVLIRFLPRLRRGGLCVFCVVAPAVTLAQVRFTTAEPPPVKWNAELIEVAAGSAERGPWRQNESKFDYVDDATVATANGNLWVAWVNQRRKNVRLQSYAPDGRARFAETVDISRSPGVFSWHPRLAIGPGKPAQVHVAWQEIEFGGGSHGGEIFYARSRDGGRTFSEPVNVSRSPGGDGKGRLGKDRWDNGSLTIALGSEGAVYLAWTEYDGALWLTRSKDGGETFAEPRQVAGGGDSPARGPSMVVIPNGTLVLAWAHGEDPDAPLSVMRSVDGGRTFEAPLDIPAPGGRADAPALTVADNGLVHLVFAVHPPPDSEELPHVVHARSPDGRAFSNPVTISRPGPTETNGAGFPTVAANERGDVFVLWELFSTDADAPRGLGFAISRDGGVNFSSPDIVPGSADPSGVNGSQQGLFGEKLALANDGALAVVNSSFFAGQGSRVWAMRGRVGSP